uniref:Autophagy-related protein 2 n=1 Tax=Brachionus calyciflorus TaxID=104777 RepID=A0A2Z4EUQ4_9BILA|nr:autophagy-related protein 2 [Brachionus calyciflorus]
MTWQIPWPEFLKKRLCRYLLQHYLGHFFKEKISLEQLSIDIYNGTGCVKNLHLDCDALNEQLNSSSTPGLSTVPIEIVSGFVGYISVYIPWHDLFNDYCKLTIKNVQVTIRTKSRRHPGFKPYRKSSDNDDSAELSFSDDSETNSMFSSMFIDSIMNTSMHIAQECLNEEKDSLKTDLDLKSGSLLGLEAFASTIDSILSRIKINLEQIQIRIENIENEKPQDVMKSSSLYHHNLSSNGIALELRIKSIKYFDLDSTLTPESINANLRNTTKNFNIEGLTIYFDEFIIRDEFDLNEANKNEFDTSLNTTLNSESNTTIDETTSPVDECPPFNFELDPNNYLYTNPIIMLTFSGIQSIKLTINNMRPTDLILDSLNTVNQHSLNQQRPFLEVSAQFGSVKSLLCPKQIHLLTGMIEKLNDYVESVNNLKREFKNEVLKKKSRLKKPVRGCDKKNSILIDSVDSDNFKSIFQISNNDPGQSSMFYSMMAESVHVNHNEKKPNFINKETSENNDDNDQILITKNLKQTIEQLQNDPIKQTIHSNHSLFQTFKITLRQFSLTLLHHDPPPLNANMSKNSRLIVERMKNVSDFYFDWSSTIETQSTQHRPDKSTFLKYHQACAFNDHFLLLLKPINFNLTQKINQRHNGQYSLNDAFLSIGYIQVDEYLTQIDHSEKRFKTSVAIEMSKNSTITELISFQDASSPQQPILEQPCLKAQVTFYDPLEKEHDQSFENVTLTLNQSLNLELDISIIDRLYYLINDATKPKIPAESKTKQDNLSKKLRNFEIKCEQVVKIGVRFPIADLSRVHQNKLQSQNEINSLCEGLKPAKMVNFRNLREQILTLHLFDLNFQTLKNAKINEPDLILTLTSSQINAYYQYNKDDRPIHFGLIQQKLNEPRSLMVQIKIPIDTVENLNQNLIDLNKEFELDSLQHQYNINVGKVVHDENGSEVDDDENESKYGPFSRTHSMISSEKNRRIVNAGSKSEMNSFMQNSKANSEMTIKLLVPDLKFLIADQHFLNDLYNCFLNDLLMYVPMQLPPIESGLYVFNSEEKNFTSPSLTCLIEANLDTEYFLANSHINLHAPFDTDLEDDKNFHMCKSAILKCESSSDQEEECCESDNDVSSGKYRKINTKKNSPKQVQKNKKHKNLLCFIFKIDQCHLKALVVHADKKDGLTNYGEFDIKANNFQMCLTTSEHFKKEDLIEKQFISIFTDTIQIGHASKSTMQLKHPTNFSTFDNIFQNSKTNTLISPNDSLVTQTLFNLSTDNLTPSVSIAIKSKFNSKLNKKDLTVALNFNNLSLNHIFTSQNNFWIFELIDLFNLIDISVSGYEVPIVVTELHLNVANSSVIYRPLHLKTQALIGFKSLHWSSNVTAESSSTLLVFNIEDIYLFISKCTEISYNLKKDFVCVANTDLFELRILINEDKNAEKISQKLRKSPILDLKIRSNVIQFRTCVDSAFALIELINYIVSDGDLHTVNQITPEIPIVMSPEADPIITKAINNASDSIPIFKTDDYSSSLNYNSPIRNNNLSYNSLPLQSPSLSYDIASSAESAISDMVKEAMNPMIQSVYGGLDNSSSLARKRNTSLSFDSQTKRMLNNDELISSNSTVQNDKQPIFGLDNDDEDKENDKFHSDDDDEFHFDMPFSDVKSSPQQSKLTSSFSFSSLMSNENKKLNENIRHSQSTIIPRQLKFDRKLHFKKRDEFELERHEESEDEDDDDPDLIKDFDVIDIIPGFGEPPRFNQDYEIKNLSKATKFELKEDHFKKPLTKIDVLKAPDTYPCPLNVYCVQEISINWFLYGGSDFDTQVIEEKESLDQSRSRQNSTSSISTSPHSFKSMSILSSPNVKYSNNNTVQFNKERYCKAGGRIIKKYDNLNWLTRGGSGRNLDICMEIALHKVKTKVDVFSDLTDTPTEYPYLYRIALAIGDIEIRDKLSSSSFNMFLFRYESDTCPKHTNSNMIFFKFLCSKSLDDQKLLECDIKVSVQPLRFNIDQDALIFLIEFFQQLASKDLNEFNKNLTPPVQLTQPIETPNSPNLNSPQQQQIFIRNFILAPDLLIKFDFSGKYDKRPDTKMDTLTKLLMVVVQLSNTEIKLKRVYYRRGFLGAEKLLQTLIKEWVSDIQRNQMKNLIKGWGIFNSLIQFFEGFTYLILCPIEQYKRDGRVLCGIQRGSAAFSTCTVLATIELTNRMFQATKNVAEFFYDLLAPHRSHQNMIGYNGGTLVDTLFTGVGPNRYVRIRRQPNDIREGLTNAYYVMYEGFNDTAANFMSEISHGAEHKGIPGAIGGALRQLPSTALAPIVLTTEATCNILSGIRNQLKPDEKKDDDQKWKTITFN